MIISEESECRKEGQTVPAILRIRGPIKNLMAIRQMLGHADLPEFVGDIDREAPYRPEQS